MSINIEYSLCSFLPEFIKKIDLKAVYGDEEKYSKLKEEAIANLCNELQKMRSAEANPDQFKKFLERARILRCSVAGKVDAKGEFGVPRKSKVTNLYDKRYIEVNRKIKHLILTHFPHLTDRTSGKRITEGDSRYTFRLNPLNCYVEKWNQLNETERLQDIDQKAPIDMASRYKSDLVPPLNKLNEIFKKEKVSGDDVYIYSGKVELKIDGEWRVLTRHLSVVPHDGKGKIDEEAYKLHGFVSLIHTAGDDFQLHAVPMGMLFNKILDPNTPVKELEGLMALFEYRLHHLCYFEAGNEAINGWMIEALRRVICPSYSPRGHQDALTQPYFSKYCTTFLDTIYQEEAKQKAAAPLYGNSGLYPDLKRSAIATLSATVKQMRRVFRDSELDDMTYYEAVLGQAGRLRGEIASKTGTPNQELFGVSREGMAPVQNLLTFLTNDTYKETNKKVKEVILTHLPQVKEWNKWYSVENGDSRYTFQVAEDNFELEEYKKQKTDPAVFNPAPKAVLESGAYVDPRERVYISDALHIYKFKTRTNFENFKGLPNTRYILRDPNVSVFVGRVELKINGKWRILTRHVATLQSGKFGKVDVAHFRLNGTATLIHLHQQEFFLHEPSNARLFNRILDLRTKEEELNPLIRALEYRLHHLCKFQRGSAAGNEIILEAVKNEISPTYTLKGNLEALAEPYLPNYLNGVLLD